MALGDRYRLHAIGFGLAHRPSVVIRHHTLTNVTLDELADTGMMPHTVARLLRAAVLARKSIVISGDQAAEGEQLLRHPGWLQSPGSAGSRCPHNVAKRFWRDLARPPKPGEPGVASEATAPGRRGPLDHPPDGPPGDCHTIPLMVHPTDAGHGKTRGTHYPVPGETGHQRNT